MLQIKKTSLYQWKSRGFICTKMSCICKLTFLLIKLITFRCGRKCVNKNTFFHTSPQWQKMGWGMLILIRQTVSSSSTLPCVLLSLGVSYFSSVLWLTSCSVSPCGDLLWSMSPSGQMNYLSPPSISGVGIMRHSNRDFNTAAQASPWIKRTVNHHRATFRYCCCFSDSPDLYGGKAVNAF